MAVTTTQTNKPFNPRGNDQSPKGYNRAALYSGKALDFDGVNDSIDISNFSLNGYTAFSICFHKTSDFNNGMIFSSADSINDGVNIYQISPGYFRARLNGVNAVDTTLKVSEKVGFFVFTYDGNNAKWYYQAQNIDSGTTTQTFAITNTTTNIARQSYASAQYLDGQIAGFKIFNTALTAAQVADLYNNPEKVVPTGVDNTALKLWLPMQEGAGTTAYDGSGNGNHGTISGATYTHGIGAPVSQTAVIDWNKGVNRLLYSNKFDEATWQKLVGSSVSATRVDGPYSEQAWSVTYDGTSAGRIEQVISGITSGTSYTCEVWARSTSGSVLVKLGGAGVETSHTLTTEWQRIDDVKNATSTTGYPRLRCDSAATIEVFGFSFRLTSEADLYIPTLATAQTSPVLLPQGLTSGRDITGVNLFENVRKQGALNLDGNSWAEVHDNASLDVTTGLTLENWIYIEDAATQGRILSKWGSTQPNRSFQMFMNNAVVRFLIGDGSSQASLNSSTSLTEGNWYHIVSTYDGANIKIYINGSADATTTETFTIYNSNEPVLIGGYIGGANTSVNPIAQPRIYNRALTASEVLQNYNSGKNTYK